MKITALEMANVKRVKALRFEPSQDGLTVIGGRNGQGKTSVLDAIAYALGGERYRPSNVKRNGAVGDTFIRIETDNGLIIERKGVNTSLTVTDKDGKRGGQALLDAFISKLAIDLPKFMNATTSEKAKTLLDILGIGDELSKLEREEKSKYDSRTAVGRLQDTKKKAADDMEWHEDAPEDELSVSDLVKEQQDILARNGIRERAKQKIDANTREKAVILEQIENLKKRLALVDEEIKEAKKDDAELESTAKIEEKISEFEAVNQKVRTNKARLDKIAEANVLGEEYESLTKEIEDIRARRLALLNGAELPLDGLTVEDGELIYNGAKWDCMSGAQQLIVACAIVSKLNPECKFVLLDKLEQLDIETLLEFDKWLAAHDLQCIATRVSTGSECSIIIDDGEIAEGEKPVIPFEKKKIEKPAALGDNDY